MVFNIKQRNRNVFFHLIIGVLLVTFIFPALLVMGVMPDNNHISCPMATMMSADCPLGMGAVMLWHHFSEWQSSTTATLPAVLILALFLIVISFRIKSEQEGEVGLRESISLKQESKKRIAVRGVILAPAINYLDLVKNYPAIV